MKFIIFFALVANHLSTGFRIPEILQREQEGTCKFTVFHKNQQKNKQHWPIYSIDSKIIYPNSDLVNYKVSANEKVEITCSKGFIENIEPKVPAATAVCVNENRFLISGTEYDLNKIKCDKYPESTVTWSTEDFCLNNEGALEILFEGLIEANNPIQQMRVCFDLLKKITKNVMYTLNPSVQRSEIWVNRNDWKSNTNIFNLPDQRNINKLYQINQQRKTINTLLGLPPTDNKYIKDDDLYFLSRGHLAANADFTYLFQKSATYQNINAAPQWQIINGGAWNDLEIAIRNYVFNNEVELEIKSGNYDTLTLPHVETGEETLLYLYVDQETKLVPVPEYFFKIVYAKGNKEGLHIFVLNNPYIKPEDIASKVICKDVLAEIPWLQIPQNISTGYVFACDLKETKKIFKDMHDWDVSGGLLL